jgi:ATP-dependent Clp protease protease subunit
MTQLVKIISNEIEAPVIPSEERRETKRHAPIRCFEGNAKPHEAFWRMRNATETGGEPEMELYGFLSEYSWLDDDITPKMFKDDLYALGKGGPITVRLNSPGGDVVAASVMRAIMSDYPGRITVRIDGLAASAAVLVAMSGSRIRIQDSAYMMIHDPAVMIFLAALDIATLATLLDTLKNIKAGVLDVYAGKTGLSRDRLTWMMSDETWMSASEAVSLGFANEVIAGGNNQPKTNTAYVNALRNYVNVPPVLLQRERETADRLSREAKALRDQVQITK